MIKSLLPDKTRAGLTWRRVQKVLRSPSLVWRNARFLWNDEVSSEKHIFVMGPPRSGTTLVKRVIESHSDVCGVEGETWFFLRKNYVDFRPPGVSDKTMRHLIRESKSVVGLFDRFANTIKRNTDANRFLEKSPRHALRMGYIKDHFPKSTIVFVVRDPRDGVRSAREHPVIWSTFPDKNRLAGYLRVWKKSVQSYLRHADYKRVLMLRYEDLCREPRETIRALLKSIGIGMEEQQLDPEAYGDTEASMSTTHTRLQEKITPESVGAWLEKLSEADVRRIERTLSEEMRVFDYSLEHTDVA